MNTSKSIRPLSFGQKALLFILSIIAPYIAWYTTFGESLIAYSNDHVGVTLIYLTVSYFAFWGVVKLVRKL